MAEKLQGKKALITGGGRGIGRAIALGFASEGADVAVAARTWEQINEVAAEIGELGRTAVPLRCDVTDATAVEAMVNQAAESLGGLDIVVNNAGGAFARGPVAVSRPEDWQHTVEVNLIGTYLVARAAIPHLSTSGEGKIINIGSGMGHQARANNAAYNAAKAGVWMFTRCLALELWDHGIEVNELVPGPVYTDLTSDVFDSEGGKPPFLADSERIKTPEECVPLAVFVAAQPPGGPTGQSFSLARRPIE